MRGTFASWLALAIVTSSAHAQDAEPLAETEADADADADADASTAALEAGRPVEKGTVGAGLIFGEPSGITVKVYLQDDQAIQGAFGASFYADAWQLNAEYVFHPWILQERDTFVLPVYVGPGVRLIRYNDGRGGMAHFAGGLRGVLGMMFDFKSLPLDVFVEAGMVIEYDSEYAFEPGFNIGAGVRYYF